jgi:hypothetical protein
MKREAKLAVCQYNLSSRQSLGVGEKETFGMRRRAYRCRVYAMQ